jgi:hypothetical protein
LGHRGRESASNQSDECAIDVPAVVDKGKGGKYLILPPDYKGKAPAGYIVLPSMT